MILNPHFGTKYTIIYPYFETNTVYLHFYSEKYIIMFQRNALIQLRTWAANSNRKPLVLRGARQVGKTTLVNEFGKEFDNYLYINLERQDAYQVFENKSNIDELLTAIYLLCNKARNSGKTLLFIDEIQQSPKAVARLRYFYEEFPQIYVIAAGSLLESLIDIHISFPVGRVEYMALRPCSFNEFLSAMGETELQKAHVAGAIPEAIHTKVMQLFNNYTLVGGMPEVVSHYAQHKDLVALRALYETLLIGYKDDVEKYSKKHTTTSIVRYILQYGWDFAAQRITLGSFAGSSYQAREMGEAFRMLEKTMLLELVYPTVNTTPPMHPQQRKSPKLLWLDTGLLNHLVGVQKEVFGANDIIDAWRGHIAEHIVAQELLASGFSVLAKRNFWVRDKKGTDAEVDFVIQIDNNIIPIEVKAGHNAKLKSLHIFMDNVNHHTAIRVWSKPFSIDNVVTYSGKEFMLYNIPFYYVSNIEKIVALK